MLCGSRDDAEPSSVWRGAGARRALDGCCSGSGRLCGWSTGRQWIPVLHLRPRRTPALRQVGRRKVWRRLSTISAAHHQRAIVMVCARTVAHVHSMRAQRVDPDRNARSHAAEFSRSLLRTGMLIAWHAPCRRLTVGRLRLIRVRSSCQDWPRCRGESLPRVSSRRVPLKEPLLRGRRPSCVSRIFILHILYFTELVGELLLRCHATVGQRASRHVAQSAWSALPLSTGARSPEPAVMSCEHAFPGVSTWRLARKREGQRSTASCVRGFG